MFDGIQRPLNKFKVSQSDFLVRGTNVDHLTVKKSGNSFLHLAVGSRSRKPETLSVVYKKQKVAQHKIMVPYGVKEN